MPTASLLWDWTGCVPLRRILTEGDKITLINPHVEPPKTQNIDQDPFEPLGKWVARSQACGLLHATYSRLQSVNGNHMALIRKGDLLVFPVSDSSQLELADALCQGCNRPVIVILCYDADVETVRQFALQTVVQTHDYTESSLCAIHRLLVHGPSWTVQDFDRTRDLDEAHRLWMASTEPRYHLDLRHFGSLIQRTGFSENYVVRNPATGDLVGFCATYTSFTGKNEGSRVRSVAALVVRAGLRGTGAGLALYDAARGGTRRIRGIRHLQLGTSFPRLLYGVPADHGDLAWFQGRGWTLNQSGPGAGRIVADWVLRFADSPQMNLASAGLRFEWCRIADVPRVLEMISRESDRKSYFGWYDEYARTVDSSFMGDVLLGFEGTTLVASAITYVPSSGSPIASDIPWAAVIGPDVGGISCICIKGSQVVPKPHFPKRSPLISLASLFFFFHQTTTQKW